MNTSSGSGLDATAIDFETANPSHASACAVGLAKIRDGAVVETASWLIAPPEGLDHFAPRNVAIHGITAKEVDGAPSWAKVLPEALSFAGGDPFVAHNASFDRSVFRKASAAFDLEVPDTVWYDTLPIARRLLTLGSYSLPFVANALGLEDFTHHEAEADAVQAARILLTLAGRSGVDSIAELANPLGIHSVPTRPGSLPRPVGDGSRAAGDFSSLAATDVLAGESVVFTGTLSLRTRAEAHALVEHYGGTWQKSVTKATTILVSGDLNPRTFRPGAEFSRKLQKAMDLAEKGQPLEILTEQDLIDRLDIGQEALEAATREQRAVGRTGWLPLHVVEQARALTGEDLNYSTWLRQALRHPAGHPGAGDQCLRCEGTIGPDVYWMFRERWMCSPECNDGLKRAAKKAWSDQGIDRPSAPSYAASWAR